MRMSNRTSIRILVCGGREYADWKTMSDTLWSIHQDTRIGQIIHGGSRGADAMAGRWAVMAGVPALGIEASWKTYGKAAGPMRNQKMLDEGKPDLVIAFPGGPGTADMIRRAEVSGVPVRRI